MLVTVWMAAQIAATAPRSPDPVLTNEQVQALGRCLWQTYPRETEELTSWQLKQDAAAGPARIKHQLCTSRPEFRGRFAPAALINAVTNVRFHRLGTCVARDGARARKALAPVPTRLDERAAYLARHSLPANLAKAGASCDALAFGALNADVTGHSFFVELVRDGMRSAAAPNATSTGAVGRRGKEE